MLYMPKFTQNKEKKPVHVFNRGKDTTNIHSYLRKHDWIRHKLRSVLFLNPAEDREMDICVCSGKKQK